MSNKTLRLHICHMYPKLLNLYGDFGNILAIKKRCFWRGIEVEVSSLNLEEKYDFSLKPDIFFIGGGQDSQQLDVSNDILKYKEKLKDFANENAVFFSICGGYQLLGKYYKPFDLEEQKGLALLDVYTVASKKRFIGNVTAKCKISNSTLVGFENHSGLTFFENNATLPLAKVVVGNGNNGKDKTEGACKKMCLELICTDQCCQRTPN